jgi:hypothetical protein
VFGLLLCVSLALCLQKQQTQPRLLFNENQKQMMATGHFGVVSKKNFFKNTEAPADTIDIAAAMEAEANSYCAPGGGSSQYGTGPYCEDGCNKCTCNKQADGSYTWCGYPYQCVGYTWGQLNISYGAYTTQPGEPFIISEIFNNSLSVPQQFTFSKEASYTNEYSWTFSTTISDSMTVSVEAGLPEICSVSDSFTASIDVTSSSTQTETHEDSWSVSQTFTVPAETTVKATMTISTAQYNMPYTSWLQFQGYGYTWCNSQVQGHYCWFIPPSYWLNSGGCYSSDGADAICPFSGTFYGLQGVQAQVSIVPVN